MTVVAEGVETVEQQAIPAQPACDEMQGYLFSKPVPPQRVGEPAAVRADAGLAAAAARSRRCRENRPRASKPRRHSAVVATARASPEFEVPACVEKSSGHGSNVWPAREISGAPSPPRHRWRLRPVPRLVHECAGSAFSQANHLKRRPPPPGRCGRSLVFRDLPPLREFGHHAFELQIRRMRCTYSSISMIARLSGGHCFRMLPVRGAVRPGLVQVYVLVDEWIDPGHRE